VRDTRANALILERLGRHRITHSKVETIVAGAYNAGGMIEAAVPNYDSAQLAFCHASLIFAIAQGHAVTLQKKLTFVIYLVVHDSHATYLCVAFARADGTYTYPVWRSQSSFIVDLSAVVLNVIGW
jgi:hypothetical protein